MESGGAEEGVQDCPACGAARLGLEGKGANMTNFKVSASQPAFPGVLATIYVYLSRDICADVWHCNVDEPVHRGARIKPPRLYIELNVTVVFRDTGVGRRGTAWTEDNRSSDALGPPSDRSSRPAGLGFHQTAYL